MVLVLGYEIRREFGCIDRQSNWELLRQEARERVLTRVPLCAFPGQQAQIFPDRVLVSRQHSAMQGHLRREIRVAVRVLCR
ncbi:hypothetical protein D3C78_1685040 [compost metagenome]